MKKLIKKNIWEVERSMSLIAAGFLFSILNIILFFYWNHHLYVDRPLLCWDFFSSCRDFFIIPSGLRRPLLYFAITTSLFNLVLFSLRRGLGLAWLILLSHLIIFTLIYIQDASLRTNMTSFYLFLTFCYLFFPSKTHILRFLFFGYIIVLAFLKFNGDWLSGAAFPNLLRIPLKGYEWIAVFSLLIEVTLPWLVLSRDRLRFFYGVAGLTVWFVFQFYFWKSFDSLASLLILLFLIFEHIEFAQKERESYYRSYAHPEPSGFWWPILLVLFIAAQWPKQPLAIFSILKMEPQAAFVECEQATLIRKNKKMTWLKELSYNQLNENLKCHPNIYFNQIKALCRHNEHQADDVSISSYLLVRTMSDSQFRVLFGSADFCNPQFRYRDPRRIQQ